MLSKRSRNKFNVNRNVGTVNVLSKLHWITCLKKVTLTQQIEYLITSAENPEFHRSYCIDILFLQNLLSRRIYLCMQESFVVCN